MLVLSRKTGQRIAIGNDIHVVVVAVQGNRVKLGIEGPATVPIHRAEVAARIAAEVAASQRADIGLKNRREHTNCQRVKSPLPV